MTASEDDLLPLSVHEHVADDNHDTMPDGVLCECDLDYRCLDCGAEFDPTGGRVNIE